MYANKNPIFAYKSFMVIGVLRNKKRGIPLFIVITIKSGSNFSMGIIFEIIMNITKIFVVNPATNDGAGFTFKYGVK